MGGVKMKRLISVIFSMIFLVGVFSFSQEKEEKFRVEVVKLKYIKSSVVKTFLEPFLSRDGVWRDNPDGTAIIIKDYPEIVEKCLKMIKEFDVKPFDILFTVQLVLGSGNEIENIDPALKDELVIKELKNLLKYKNFSFLDKTVVRVTNGGIAKVLAGKGQLFSLEFVYPKLIKEDKEELISTYVRLEKLEEKEPSPSKIRLIETTISFKPGEKTVVGVSKMDGSEKGLILIISGKIVE